MGCRYMSVSPACIHWANRRQTIEQLKTIKELFGNVTKKYTHLICMTVEYNNVRYSTIIPMGWYALTHMGITKVTLSK